MPRIMPVAVSCLAAWWVSGVALASEQTVVGGPGNDYQASVIVPWSAPQQRILVFERLDAGFSGDLLLTRSEDGGVTWSGPEAIVSGAANERHPTLVQTAPASFLLLYLSNASGGFRIHRASSADGSQFQQHGAIDLGWVGTGEINPQLSRDPDGSLNLVYHRLSGAAYIARSTDGGLSWDTLRTQISPGNAALPRIARRASDGRYLLLYQTGSSAVSIWTKTSLDPYDWSGPAQLLVADGNNHDGWPLALDNGRWLILWARVSGGAFQIHASHSADALVWTSPQIHNERPGLANVQPHALPGAVAGTVELYWGAAQVAGSSNHDIVRRSELMAVPELLADGFE